MLGISGERGRQKPSLSLAGCPAPCEALTRAGVGCRINRPWKAQTSRHSGWDDARRTEKEKPKAKYRTCGTDGSGTGGAAARGGGSRGKGRWRRVWFCCQVFPAQPRPPSSTPLGPLCRRQGELVNGYPDGRGPSPTRAPSPDSRSGGGRCTEGPHLTACPGTNGGWGWEAMLFIKL